MTHMNPKVTVLIPVYNGEKYLHEALDSILNQSFKDFELLIIDDASADTSAAIIQSYSDPRIRLFKNEQNLGIAATLNQGMHLSRGKYIARMDCDDISHPSRLKKQVAFLDRNPDVAACGTFIKTLGEVKSRTLIYPKYSEEIQCTLLFGSALAHPSVMFRKTSLEAQCLLYDENQKYVEDYELWVRLLEHGLKLTNLGEVLLTYRFHPNPHQAEQINNANSIRRCLLEELGLVPSSDEIRLHNSLCNNNFKPDLEFLRMSEVWLMRILKANQEMRKYSSTVLLKVLASRWLNVIRRSTYLGMVVWENYTSSFFKESAQLSLKGQAKLFTKCMLKRS